MAASDRGGATLGVASCYPEVGVARVRGDPCVPRVWKRREMVGAAERLRASLSWGRQIGEVGAEGAGRNWTGLAAVFASEANEVMALADLTCDGPWGGGGPCWAGRDCAARKRDACRSWLKRQRSTGCQRGRVSWQKFARDFECFETRRRCRLHVVAAAVVVVVVVVVAAAVVAQRPEDGSRYRSPLEACRRHLDEKKLFHWKAQLLIAVSNP